MQGGRHASLKYSAPGVISGVGGGELRPVGGRITVVGCAGQGKTHPGSLHDRIDPLGTAKRIGTAAGDVHPLAHGNARAVVGKQQGIPRPREQVHTRGTGVNIAVFLNLIGGTPRFFGSVSAHHILEYCRAGRGRLLEQLLGCRHLPAQKTLLQ